MSWHGICHPLVVFDTGTKNPPDTRIRIPQIWIQMTTSVSVAKSVSISMISVPTAAGIYYQFRLFSRDFLQIFVIFYLFFQLFLSIILYSY